MKEFVVEESLSSILEFFQTLQCEAINIFLVILSGILLTLLLLRNKQQKHIQQKCFIGVGGGGSNILSDISNMDSRHTFIYINSDYNALVQKNSEYKILLTSEEKKDKWGCGGNTECGVSLIDEKVKKKLKEFTKEYETIYLIATLGGGVGSGSTPEIIKYLKTIGKKVIIYVTLPFKFEGKVRQRIANETLKALKNTSRHLVVLENDELLKSKKGMKEAFKLTSKSIYKQIIG